ncbi:MAG TPA: protein kinase [Gemmatimonadales bacterium]|nr:protein kinase [Gemmatimonadales bacterium]
MTEPTSALAPRLAEALGGAFTVEGEIGRGGMGVVYRARDERLKRRVAIKVLPPELAFQAEIRARFTREAETAARLSHPHIVPIYTVGEGSGLVYFVMGYVDGESLAARLKRRGKLPVEECRRIMKEVADALSAAHALSVIHRDIKPDNILLDGTRSRVMVTDFGIAKAMSAGSGATLTSAGVAIGTPQYMSPEQAAGEKEIDGRSDLYSLGIVSYQMLTGELPFSAPTVAGILMKQITEMPPSLEQRRPDCPEDLLLAVMRCLEKDPENRWPSADALRRALESRVVTGYRPTGQTKRGAGPRPSRPLDAPRRNSGRGAGLGESAAPPPAARSLAGDDWRDRLDRHMERASQRMERANRRVARSSRSEDTPLPVPDTGEPRIVQRTRAHFAKWAAWSAGTFMINLATSHLDPPWFLFVAGVMGIRLVKDYQMLWQAGYTWRDVLNRPPAPDAILAPGGKGKAPRQIPPPRADEYGQQVGAVLQAHTDRGAILKLLDRMTPAERQMLPDDVRDTVDALYRRATELAKTLAAMDGSMDLEGVDRIDQRLKALEREPADEERQRRMDLLQRQKKTLGDLRGRRDQIASQLESCVLAMQNVRFDLLRLRSADAAAALGDLTNATQQARALSRDVDNAIVAASEIREVLGRPE